MKTVNIKGKEYVEVNERIKYFRENYSDGQILTSLESLVDGVCVFRAEVYVNDKLVATGHAYEKEGSTFINKTSYIENCETSAIGRALGIYGIGIDTSIASSDEVNNAIINQDKPTKYDTAPTTTQPARITLPQETPRYDNENEMWEDQTKKYISTYINGLDKPENVKIKVSVMKGICGHYEVDSMHDIPKLIKSKEQYDKLISVAKTEFNKEKTLMEAGL